MWRMLCLYKKRTLVMLENIFDLIFYISSKSSILTFLYALTCILIIISAIQLIIYIIFNCSFKYLIAFLFALSVAFLWISRDIFYVLFGIVIFEILLLIFLKKYQTKQLVIILLGIVLFLSWICYVIGFIYFWDYIGKHNIIDSQKIGFAFLVGFILIGITTLIYQHTKKSFK